jgi:uncharacterized delta-60 repeat protein
MSRVSKYVAKDLKAVLALVCALTVATALMAAPALAKPGAKPVTAGHLDRSFSKDGKLLLAFPPEGDSGVGVKYTLPFQFNAGHLAMAPSQGGKTVVAGSTRIVRVLANGKLDRSFGSGGTVVVQRPPGMSFVLADVAVDSQGRVLLAGTARPLPTSSTPDPLLSSAAVMRFNADGSVDRSFGKEGVLVTSFGIKPPQVPTGHYTGAAVGIKSLAVDGQDRPVLTGAAVIKASFCSPTSTVTNGFVARLTSSGALDPSFDGDGLREITELGAFGEANVLGSGAVLAVGTSKSGCEYTSGGPAVLLTEFGPEGNLRPGFGNAGFRAVGFGSAPVATVTPAGKILLLGSKSGKSQLVERLTRSGGLDPSFGRTGRVYVTSPKNVAFTAIGVDRQERILLAGHATKRLHGKHNKGIPRSSFVISRMKSKGTFDRSFGHRGSARTGFGGPSSASATQLYVDAKGRITVGGNVVSGLLGTGSGFALARYLSR